MNKEREKHLEADEPLSLADGAPGTVEIAGAPMRLTAAMDYRIVNVVDDALDGSLDDWDASALMVYCALHATKKQVAELWKKARDPMKLYDKLQLWQAQMPADKLTQAIEELMEYNGDLDKEQDIEDDGGEQNSGKKKTTPQ